MNRRVRVKKPPLVYSFIVLAAEILRASSSDALRMTIRTSNHKKRPPIVHLVQAGLGPFGFAQGKQRRYMNAPETGLLSAAGAKGHCLISRVQIRKATTPRATSSRPHLRRGPVCQKSQAQAAMVRTAGAG